MGTLRYQSCHSPRSRQDRLLVSLITPINRSTLVIHIEEYNASQYTLQSGLRKSAIRIEVKWGKDSFLDKLKVTKQTVN